ncbi:helix-turn-helix transcriptional regulator [Desulfobacula sp.]|uniref:helix-turn-helix domain-containing protein n=1 Tax=Desulfobacula sp. TaxID=2593537 RepID=UPI00261F16B3|nr:helix-turn-helix transcriptional regulator [Desulfobacula sp.]
MDIDQIKTKLGFRLKALRLDKELKQEDLENFNFSYRHYGKIERGQVNPTLGTLARLCELFDVSLSELFFFMDDKGSTSDIQQEVAAKIRGVLKENDEAKLSKLKIFLNEIL